MPKIKIWFFLHFLVLIISFILLLNIIIIYQNIFDIDNLKFFLIYFIYVSIFYFVLKNNLLAIKFFALINFILLWWIHIFYTIYEWISLEKIWIFSGYAKFYISIIIMIIILFKLFYLHKNIKKWTENLEKKLVTNKNQTKTFIIYQILILIFLVIFRYWYYDIEEKKLEIDKSFFISKYQNTEIKDEDNLYISIKKFKYNEKTLKQIGTKKKAKEKFFECLYENKCYWNLEDYEKIVWKLNWTIDFDNKYEYWKKEITNKTRKFKVKLFLNKNISVLYNFDENHKKMMNLFILELSNKKYFKKVWKEFPIYTNLLNFNRETNYDILFNLKNNKQNKAINILETELKIYLTMLDWDWDVIDILVAHTLIKNKLKIMGLILNNFEITKENKNKLAILLKKEITSKPLDNALIYQDRTSAKEFKDSDIPLNTTLLQYENFRKMHKEKLFYQIKYKWNPPKKLIKQYELSTKNISYFKSNYIWKYLFGYGWLYTYREQYKEFENLENFRKKVLEKLEK